MAKEKVLRGYKAVDVDTTTHPPTLRSLIVGVPAKVTYRVGKWVIPNRGCGPLCLYSYSNGGYVTIRHNIYEAEYVPSEEEKVWGWGDENRLSSLWEGTVLAKKIRLIRRLR